jgi:hypothetical protein
MEGDAVLGFRLSGSHGSILPRHVQNRLPEHQSEQAHHCYGDCNLDVSSHGLPPSPFCWQVWRNATS